MALRSLMKIARVRAAQVINLCHIKAKRRGKEQKRRTRQKATQEARLWFLEAESGSFLLFRNKGIEDGVVKDLIGRASMD